MGKTRRMPLIMIIFTLLGCSEPSPAAASGTYISRGPSYAFMLQIERTNGYQIEGTISGVELYQDGEVKAFRSSIAGTIEGNAVNFSIIHPPGNKIAVVPASGVVTDEGLRLTLMPGDQVTTFIFKEGSASEYSAFVQAVQQKSMELTSKK